MKLPMHALATLLATILAASTSVAQTVPAPAAQAGMKLMFSEECGAPQGLDAEWSFENGMPDSRDFMLSSRWRTNVSNADGNCLLTQKRESKLANKEWTSAHMWTKKTFQYGYFEARMRFNTASGVDNAFWLMGARKKKLEPGETECEIDIVEGAYPNIATNNLHLTDSKGHRAKQMRKTLPPKSDGFYKFAALWTKDTIRWYIDDQMVREEPNNVCHSPLAIRLSTAVLKIKGFVGDVTDAIDGTSMAVDYVRVYQ